MTATAKKVILFDGVCNLCHGAINFIIAHDKNDMFRYASLQSAVGQKLTHDQHIDTSKIDSILLLDTNGKTYHKSTAALYIAKSLNGIYALSFVFIIVPKVLRDWIYDGVAKNRYRWFGKKDQCMLPTPELKALFIDQNEAHL